MSKKIREGTIFTLEDIKKMVALVIKGMPVNRAAEATGMSASYAHRIIRGEKHNWDISPEAVARARSMVKKRGRPGEPSKRRSLSTAEAQSVRDKWLTADYSIASIARAHKTTKYTVRQIINGVFYAQGVDPAIIEACKKVDRSNKPMRLSVRQIKRVKKLFESGLTLTEIVRMEKRSPETVRRMRDGHYDKFL